MRDPQTGCWQQGIPLFWPQQCISYAVNTAGSPLLGLDYAAAAALVDGAFAHWPTATCSDGGSPSIAFMGRTGLTCDRVEYNPTGPNANAILFRDDELDPRSGGDRADHRRVQHQDRRRSSTPTWRSTRRAHRRRSRLRGDARVGALPRPRSLARSDGGHVLPVRRRRGDAAAVRRRLEAICTAYPTSRPAPACDFEPPKGFATDCGGDVDRRLRDRARAPVARGDLVAGRRPRPGWLDGAALGALRLSLGARRRPAPGARPARPAASRAAHGPGPARAPAARTGT